MKAQTSQLSIKISLEPSSSEHHNPRLSIDQPSPTYPQGLKLKICPELQVHSDIVSFSDIKVVNDLIKHKKCQDKSFSSPKIPIYLKAILVDQNYVLKSF